MFGAPALEAYCTAMLGLFAFSDGETATAMSLAAQARTIAVDHGLEEAPGMSVVSAACSLAAAHAGDPSTAQTEWRRARTQVAMFADLFGWANVQTRVALARTSLLLGDRPGAEAMIREARTFLIQQPDAVRAIRQVTELEESVGHAARHAVVGSSALTTAELRVLFYLPTNLTLAEIGARLYVSRYTVKTHCESIYRKLAVGSRSEAVEAARRIGLLEIHPALDT